MSSCSNGPATTLSCRAARAEGYTLYTYGAIQAWAQAVSKAGTTDTGKMISALQSGQFDTVLGKIGFDKTGDVTAPGSVWYEWKNGTYDYR